MTESQLETLWYGAFSYYCGRMTIAVSTFTELLIQEWPKLSERTKFFIQRDLEKAFDEDDEARKNEESYKRLGDNCDRAQWEKVRALYL